LLLVIHHLVVDGVSWRILVEDLQTTYQQRARIKLPSKRPRSSSGQSNCGMRQRCSKFGLPWQSVNMFPICRTILGANTVASARIMSVTLSVAETKVLLQEVPAAITPNQRCVADGAGTRFAQWTESAHCSLTWRVTGGRKFDNVAHARWFTSIFPVLLGDLGILGRR